MSDLPPRQAEALDLIRRFLAKDQIPPTATELAMAMGISRHAAERHLRALHHKGHIYRRPNVARGIALPSREGVNNATLQDSTDRE